MTEQVFALQFDGFDNADPEHIQRFKAVCIADLQLTIPDTQRLLESKTSTIIKTGPSLDEIQHFYDLLRSAGAKVLIVGPSESEPSNNSTVEQSDEEIVVDRDEVTLELEELLNMEVPLKKLEQESNKSPKEYVLEMSDNVGGELEFAELLEPTADTAAIITKLETAIPSGVDALVSSVRQTESELSFDSSLELGPPTQEVELHDSTATAAALSFESDGLEIQPEIEPEPLTVSLDKNSLDTTVETAQNIPVHAGKKGGNGKQAHTGGLDLALNDEPLEPPPLPKKDPPATTSQTPPASTAATPPGDSIEVAVTEVPRPQIPAEQVVDTQPRPTRPLAETLRERPTKSENDESVEVIGEEGSEITEEGDDVVEEIVPHSKKFSHVQLGSIILVGLLALGTANFYFLAKPSVPEIPPIDPSMLQNPELIADSVGQPSQRIPTKIPGTSFEGNISDPTYSLTFSANQNGDKITAKMVVTTPQPPELTLEEIGRAEKPHIWLRKGESDVVTLQRSGEHQWIANAPIYFFIERGAERRRLPGSAMMSLTMNSDGATGDVTIEASYSALGDTILPPQGLIVDANSEDRYRVMVSAKLPVARKG